MEDSDSPGYSLVMEAWQWVHSLQVGDAKSYNARGVYEMGMIRSMMVPRARVRKEYALRVMMEYLAWVSHVQHVKIFQYRGGRHFLNVQATGEWYLRMSVAWSGGVSERCC